MGATRMRFCKACSDYTLQAACPRCSGQTVQNTPAKYSPEDHYGEYRRRLRKLGPANRPAGRSEASGAGRPGT